MGKIHPSMRITLRKRSSGTRRRESRANRIAGALYAHHAELLEPEAETVPTLKARFKVDGRILTKMFESPGSVYIFGDAHHGSPLFTMLTVIWHVLTAAQKSILKKSHFFTEAGEAYESVQALMPGHGEFYPLDTILHLNPTAATADEMMAKRFHMLNNHWAPYIAENLTTTGLNIVALGRSHLYPALGLPENAAWPPSRNRKTPAMAFQNALQAESADTKIETFVVVNPDDDTNLYNKADADLIRPVLTNLRRFYFI